MSTAGIFENFNKTIRIDLISLKGTKIIKCPPAGRKPDITVSGVFYNVDVVNNLEVRIKGLYIDNLYEYNRINIYMGYNDCYEAHIEATVVNAYISKPAPDRETVFVCQQGRFDSWSKATCDLKLKAGMPLSAAIQTLSKTIDGFKVPAVAANVTETLNEPFQFKGYSKEAFHALSKLFPGLDFTVANNQLVVTKPAGGGTSVKKLRKLTSPPQYNGSSITVTTLYNQNLKPGDVFFLDAKYFIKTTNLMKFDSFSSRFKVYAIKFEFATVGAINSMTVQANVIKEA